MWMEYERGKRMSIMSCYNPPSETNWVYTHPFHPMYAKAYIEGFMAAKCGQPESDNLYPTSGNERDTTLSDELHFWWYVGHGAFE
jgi:hypothetical protein